MLSEYQWIRLWMLWCPWNGHTRYTNIYSGGRREKKTTTTIVQRVGWVPKKRFWGKLNIGLVLKGGLEKSESELYPPVRCRWFGRGGFGLRCGESWSWFLLEYERDYDTSPQKALADPNPQKVSANISGFKSMMASSSAIRSPRAWIGLQCRPLVCRFRIRRALEFRLSSRAHIDPGCMATRVWVGCVVMDFITLHLISRCSQLGSYSARIKSKTFSQATSSSDILASLSHSSLKTLGAQESWC